jgi:hypothetical protein
MSEVPKVDGSRRTIDDDIVEIGGKRYKLRAATPAEEFYLNWGRESLKSTTPYLNDVLQKIIILTTALIGGGLLSASAKEEVLSPRWRMAALCALIASLVTAFWGIYPHGGPKWLSDPDVVRRFEHETIDRKVYWLWWSAVLLILGLGAAVVGLWIKTTPF